MLPALLSQPLQQMASEFTEGEPSKASQVETMLGVAVGRLVRPGGWTDAQRDAGAEVVVTGRAQPYAESTVRKRLRVLARQGGTSVAARAVQKQVHHAVATADSTERIAVYTDMYDQVCWTKKPAHAGPVGNRGNRILAATYFGMTFVRIGQGPALGYHVSWHKPASPLLDGLQALYADKDRAAWLKATAHLHIWDRGGCGLPTLRWARERGIPYLTVSNGSVSWKDYEAPRVHTDTGVPVFVRPDPDLFDWDCLKGAPIPCEIIFPAHPDKGQDSSRALRYRSARLLSEADLAAMDVLYKSRWPSNENAIKSLSAVGFGVNRDRNLEPTTSRGTDGQLLRLEQRVTQTRAELQALQEDPTRSAAQKRTRRERKLQTLDAQRTQLQQSGRTKGARVPTGTELLCKNLMLLIYNALALLLAKSPLQTVRTLTPLRVRALLLGRSVWSCIEAERITLWIDPVPNAAERSLQEELLRLFEAQQLTLGGRSLRLRLQPLPQKSRPRRICA